MSRSIDYNVLHLDAEKRGITEGPHGWIQWKGTDVCMDIHCSCGAHGHVDADFLYHVQCGACGQWYGVASHVSLIPIDFEPDGCAAVADVADDESGELSATDQLGCPSEIQQLRRKIETYKRALEAAEKRSGEKT